MPRIRLPDNMYSTGRKNWVYDSIYLIPALLDYFPKLYLGLVRNFLSRIWLGLRSTRVEATSGDRCPGTRWQPGNQFQDSVQCTL